MGISNWFFSPRPVEQEVQTTEQPVRTYDFSVSKRELQLEKTRKTAVGTKDVQISQKISGTEILEGEKETWKNFCLELRDRGYAILKVGKDCFEASEELEKVSKEFFSLPIEQKELSSDPDRNNIGFVSIPGTREYIKLRPSDPISLWPQQPENFTSTFNKFFQEYSKISFACFEALASFIDEMNPNRLPLLKPQDTEAIREFISGKSSISVIRYFIHDLESATVCSEHKDTGILTFIVRTKFPSLEIWDKSLEQYVKIEELSELGDLIVFLGEKVPLFSGSKTFCATPHRVIMGGGKERISIAFLLDVAK
eukprot:TRINITY_DN7919_c0_g1_i1.p1 TRINITY_DN7919_c0_g1~~TRINITY_DN7919_c0_g1_i1.p1  ORF type:complete len:311 (-),score=65.36 TRINITY_DN7919_c0_g1_i1:114-1046(-)